MTSEVETPRSSSLDRREILDLKENVKKYRF